MMLYVIFPIHVNFPIRSRCVLKAIFHRKNWIVLCYLRKFFFEKVACDDVSVVGSCSLLT